MAKIAFLTAGEGIERVELVDPWKAVTDAGHEPELVSPADGEVRLFNHLDPADTQRVDRAVSDANVEDYTALILPGGVANPDALRADPTSVEFVRAFVASGKPVAAICHAPWVLVEADVVRGRRIASFPSIQTDVRNAGGEWTDEQVVIDDNIITSRNPDDIPAFCQAVLEQVSSSANA